MCIETINVPDIRGFSKELKKEINPPTNLP